MVGSVTVAIKVVRSAINFPLMYILVYRVFSNSIWVAIDWRPLIYTYNFSLFIYKGGSKNKELTNIRALGKERISGSWFPIITPLIYIYTGRKRRYLSYVSLVDVNIGALRQRYSPLYSRRYFPIYIYLHKGCVFPPILQIIRKDISRGKINLY